MKKMVLGRDYEMRRDNDFPLARDKWVIFIRGNGYDKLCGRFHNVMKVGQNISFGFEPTYIPDALSNPLLPHHEQDLANDPQLQGVLSGILYDILDRGRNEGSLLFTDPETGQNLNKAAK